MHSVQKQDHLHPIAAQRQVLYSLRLPASVYTLFTEVLYSPVALTSSSGDNWGALVQYLLIAEQGSEAAASNAAWMLRQGMGYTGPGYLDLAADMLERWVDGGVFVICSHEPQ